MSTSTAAGKPKQQTHAPQSATSERPIWGTPTLNSQSFAGGFRPLEPKRAGAEDCGVGPRCLNSIIIFIPCHVHSQPSPLPQ